ncbi:hypothetical protein TSAR_008302 [Trichomalopsis sarcophagae]|uniref:Phosphatidic acid phosphatase type 2/haloperoxidase domain-containing protein n=1 Tax=Trichomalopsis sarcophagae TaxID=543379 RepID=A0A232FH05_9HYME|nr:hypothetical protein TSAR_008302 [Trichomalopsis sarcophagae]
MWSNFVQYCKDPHLVARIQEFFGVEIHYDRQNKSKDDCSSRSERNGLNKSSFQSINGCTPQENEGTIKKRHNKVLQSSDNDASTTAKEDKPYTIKNHFWYYLFLFGTQLGDEVFYSTFIPFWFWNIDGAVGRRIVLVWAIIMTIGQALKDIICWPRPQCPPVVRLQSKWSLEYGMPSTHAMVGVSIPFSVVLFTMNRYIYSFPAGCVAAVLWCTLICVSRLYLGMHTVLDVITGLVLAILMMIPLVPLVDAMDYYFLTNSWALSALVVMSIATIIYYPCSDKWTPTRGDTTLVVSVTAGVHIGAWLNFKTGALSMPQVPPPYNIMWPSYPMFGRMVLRTILGFCCVLGTKAICKSLSYTTICAILRVNSKELMQSENSLENKNKILVDLVYKYIFCFMIGFNTVYILPNVFTMIGIERPTFYTEI